LIYGNKQILIELMPLAIRSQLSLWPLLVFASLAIGAASSLAADDQLKPHQAVSTNAPPASPENFNPDPSELNLPPLPPLTTNWSRNVSVSSNAPSPQFNPDPGASLRPPAGAPAALFNEPSAPPIFTPAPIAPEQSLPRAEVRSGEILPPTAPTPLNYGLEPLTNGLALPRANTRRELRINRDFSVPKYSADKNIYPTNTAPRPDRWRLGFVPWKRYTAGVVEQPYETPEPWLWAPYGQSLLKGDLPVIGQNIFLDLTAAAETVTEFKRVPTASGVSAAMPGAYEFYGQSEQLSIQNNLSLAITLFQGETVFRPVDWLIKLEPVFNVNYLEARETGVVSPDPRGSIGGNNGPPPPGNGFVLNPGDIDALLNGQLGPADSFRASRSTQRTETFATLQMAFGEIHLRDLSDNYDSVSLRGGIQPFNGDFRGFIFNDVNLGVRLFGNYANNLCQYNLAAFDMLEKDTYSGLNTFDRRDQQVIVANVYRQDLIWPGYTAELSFFANLDHGGTHYDEAGNLARPAPIGTVRPHSLQAYYFGWAGDGHIGRFNVSHALYEVIGRDDFNGLAGRPVNINAQMAALEISYDRDWARYKFSFLYASGDGHTEDGTATGFDTIVDNPNFTGGPFSYWTRQGFNLGGTMVNLKTPSSLVPDLRTSKTEGQANFVNPGAFILGLGAEFDLTPKLRSFLNANYILFAETDPIKTALLTSRQSREVGWDLSLGFQYRPLLTDNIIISAGLGVLLPGQGFRDIYQTNTDPVPGFDRTNRRGAVDDFLYSGLIAVTFTY
jgi:hypothetical protein